MTYVVTRPCCNDASCVAVCPVNCIHPTPDEPEYMWTEMLYIDPTTCIDCGACVEVCPVDAIVSDFDLTDENARFADINAHYFRDPNKAAYPTTRVERATTRIEVNERGPLRVAVVGSGPAACYAAEELLSHGGLETEVTMFERLPAPWGLVRFGVAPDHQDTKAVTKLFSRAVARRGIELHLNVEVGRHVTHKELLEHHHAVLYAVGAASDRRLGIPGEDLPGSHSATDFVGWYNGHPDFADRSFDLSDERAVIIGNGNVALDVARILVSDVRDLARTDIADHALKSLSTSRITEVVVLGRRGPAQAAYTTPELLGLASAPRSEVVVNCAESVLDLNTRVRSTENPHSMQMKTTIVRELAGKPSLGYPKRVVLRYLASPTAIIGDEQVRAVRVNLNQLVGSGSDHVEVVPTGVTEEIRCGLVLRAIGYKGVALPDLPFDEVRGILPNDGGRVVHPDTGEPLTGVYTAGWIKRGAAGVIGTNKKCAEDTVAALLEDFTRGRLISPPKDREALRELIEYRQPLAIDYRGWEAIDRHERSAATDQSRPRIKLVDVQDMLTVAHGGP